MNELRLHFENCYGINKLAYNFNFIDRFGKRAQSYCLYASNGIMKTSFAKTLNDYMNGLETKDLIQPDLKTERSITDEKLVDISPESIFVAESYNEEFKSDKISRLLVNDKLRKQYESIQENLELNKDAFLCNIKKTGILGKTFDIENELCEVFECDNLYNLLNDLKDSVGNNDSESFSTIPYKVIFNEKTELVMQEKSFIKDLRLYVNKYNSLLGSSKIFHSIDFDYIKARKVAESLGKNGFFKAENTIHIKGIDDKDIKTQEELNKLIENEINNILTDEELRKDFDRIEKKLKKNEQTIRFSEYLSNHPELIPELINPNLLKQKILTSYIKVNEQSYLDLLDAWDKTRHDLLEIRKIAMGQKTYWHDIVKVFTERFHVPFKVKISNEADAVLGQNIPVFEFYYGGDKNKKDVDRKTLLSILSTGEKRALYILNLLYEIEARRYNETDTIIIMDDIVDSFDYKNKYAIIEYLEEISKENNFYLIILTHNFDFMRTLVSRNIVPLRDHCLMATRGKDEISLSKAEYINNPFRFFLENSNEPSKFIALIPFVRNLIEYSIAGYQKDEDYLQLTSTLHMKENSDRITIGNIKTVLQKHIRSNFVIFDGSPNSTIMKDFILKTADTILNDNAKQMLEDKIVLSIAIRLKAEIYVIKNSEENDLPEIRSNQTRILIDLFLEKYSPNDKIRSVLKKINLITPENIHLNSFMYEPIIDMSIDELKTLYHDISNL